MWRYIDNKEQIQGPFSANQMLLWYNMGFFEKGLLMLGTAKKLAPPHLPGELRAPVARPESSCGAVSPARRRAAGPCGG